MQRRLLLLGVPGAVACAQGPAKLAPHYPAPESIVVKMLELGGLAISIEMDSSADLITVYLLPNSNDKVQPLLERQLRKGARVVAYDFEFRAGQP